MEENTQNNEEKSPSINLKDWKTWAIGLVLSGSIGSPVFIAYQFLTDPGAAIQTIQGANINEPKSCNVRNAELMDKIEGLKKERDNLQDDCGHKIKVSEINDSF